jgi:diaminohydroxyphosphoribosylaminopyrimidine deaminase/5-amino-6-(5-phosphoribosylamino)uracil reductase
VVDAALDREFMARALFLAERGRGLTTPNPLVGAVVVSPEGVVVGQGAHMRAGGPHAEVVALEAAGPRARGATLYCTLEPCAHHGRTGPCCERIVAAGVARVVVAAGDPNPAVSGRGLKFLTEHGVALTEGTGEDDARRQLAPFFTWITHRRPFVIAKTAASLDGFVGRATERVRLTGPVANRYFQRQRAEVDAISVGAETVLIDDPRLTARGAFRTRPLVRVVFDWRGRIAPSAQVLSTLSAGPVIMVTLEATGRARPGYVEAMRAAGADVWTWPARDLRAVLDRLATLDVVTLLVEGGPTLQNAFAEAGLVDRVQWVVVPRDLGDGVPPMSALSPRSALPGLTRTRHLGQDLFIEFDVHGIDRSHRTH